MRDMDTFLNGKFMSAGDACLNIEDRGTLFGDGVYEFFRIHEGRVFLAAAHLRRLRYSANELELAVPYCDEEILVAMDQLIENNQICHGGIYLQLTRGASPRLHCFPENCCPNFFLVAREMPLLPPSLYESGVHVVLLADQRWKRCDIKSLNLLANILAKEKAKRLGFFDAILYSELGITESTSSSVMAVINGELVCTPPGPWVLPGITKDTLLDLAPQLGQPVAERFMNKDDLLAASEVMLTSTMVDVLPVTEVDGKPIGSGKPGPVAAKLLVAIREMLNER